MPTAVLVSGAGTNLQAIIAEVRAGDLPLDLRLVIANKPQATALRHAREARIPTQVLEFDRARQDLS
ncbi:MAG: phosphoribosylglycinamide formyltransferase, partial [Candidatus Eremiobacteraeota bacterium]|nr:phosphoribosylglycinamide formyltransferase [Candidatus Eremiobacteraeota bacterium]